MELQKMMYLEDGGYAKYVAPKRNHESSKRRYGYEKNMKALLEAVDLLFPKSDPRSFGKKNERTFHILYKFVSMLFDHHFIGREKAQLLEEALGRSEQGVGVEDDTVNES
jgi:hypothetical protein